MRRCDHAFHFATDPTGAVVVITGTPRPSRHSSGPGCSPSPARPVHIRCDRTADRGRVRRLETSRWSGGRGRSRACTTRSRRPGRRGIVEPPTSHRPRPGPVAWQWSLRPPIRAGHPSSNDRRNGHVVVSMGRRHLLHTRPVPRLRANPLPCPLGEARLFSLTEGLLVLSHALALHSGRCDASVLCCSQKAPHRAATRPHWSSSHLDLARSAHSRRPGRLRFY